MTGTRRETLLRHTAFARSPGPLARRRMRRRPLGVPRIARRSRPSPPSGTARAAATCAPHRGKRRRGSRVRPDPGSDAPRRQGPRVRHRGDRRHGRRASPPLPACRARGRRGRAPALLRRHDAGQAPPGPLRLCRTKALGAADAALALPLPARGKPPPGGTPDYRTRPDVEERPNGEHGHRSAPDRRNRRILPAHAQPLQARGVGSLSPGVPV
jgi:hypothetical protein